ncbi:hypothetical protein JT26_00445 [Porphyromonas sp. COT-108 OH1349]|nr:hypothetical protein JT26_00445 [Porphyromonas sp. COT-108 OH1349]
MRVGTTFSPKKKPETFATYLWQPYRADTRTPNNGTRINQKAPKRLNKSLRGFFSLSLKRAGDQKKRSKRKSLRNS